MKTKTHIRLANLPICPELTRTKMPRASDTGHFRTISGTIIRTTVVKMLEYARNYVCAKCKHVFTVEVWLDRIGAGNVHYYITYCFPQAKFEQHSSIIKPLKCDGDRDGEPCDSTKFSPVDDVAAGPSMCRDYQVWIQTRQYTCGSN